MASSDDQDDDVPQLSGDALAALREFYTERETREKLFEDLKDQSEVDHVARKPLSMEAFTEDWNASQFWYTDDTARQLAQQLLSRASKDSRIAVISAPSVFLQLKNILAERKAESADDVLDITLLEFDERFAVFKEFVHYDFEQPTKLPPELRGQFDFIICDPPFLSEDCQTKAALTVRWLSKAWAPTTEDQGKEPLGHALHLIVCTGERMEPLIHKLYSKVGLATTSFEVQHARGLSNEFRCYSNFRSDIWELQGPS